MGAAHSSQNFAPSRFSWAQEEQRMTVALYPSSSSSAFASRRSRVSKPSVNDA